jgi:hypothetical protein
MTMKTKTILTGLILAVNWGISSEAAWQLPIGIPAPEFGIEEAHTMYAGQNYDYDNDGKAEAPYQSDTNGPYTHYVDNQNPNATDINNNYGTEAKPRKSFPTNIRAGSVVEMHNGPYPFSLLGLSGTSAKPIFIHGVDKQHAMTFAGTGDYSNVKNCQYVIVENAVFKGDMQNADDPIIGIDQYNSHFSIRHCEIDGQGAPPGIYIWTQQSTYVSGQKKEHIVVYDDDIHNCGNYPQTPNSNWNHGVMIDNASQNVWVVDCRIYKNGADGIQILDRANNGDMPANAPAADRIFIGRNILHDNSESGIDTKGATNIIYSQNEIYGARQANAHDNANGDALRINDEGTQDNIWIIFNKIHDCDIGVGAYGAEFPPYVIGNVIYNISDAAKSEGDAITYGAGDVVGNTIYKCDKSFNAEIGGMTVANNIIADVPKGEIGHSNVVIKNNLFWHYGEQVDGCTGCVVGDPNFFNANGYDFRLDSGSAAIGKGLVDPAKKLIQTYQQLYNINIDMDIIGSSRQLQSGWDIGAYQYDDSTSVKINLNKTFPASVDCISLSYFSGIVRLQCPGEKCQVSVIDLKGRLVAAAVVMQHRFTFKNKPRGVYMVTVSGNYGPVALKMIVP